MGRIDVGKQAIQSAWHRHETVGKADSANDSHLLVLIYAVECCLNRYLMAREQVHHTSQIAKDLLFGHRLDRLATEVGAPPVSGYTAEVPNQYVPPEDLHSLFRYGGRLRAADRQDLLTRLERILVWAKENSQ